MGRPKVYKTEEERLRVRQEVKRKCDSSRISIGNQLGRWNALKSELQITSGADLAKLLLDRHFSDIEETTHGTHTAVVEKGSLLPQNTCKVISGQKRKGTHSLLLTNPMDNYHEDDRPPKSKKSCLSNSSEEEEEEEEECMDTSLDPADASYNPSNESMIEYQSEFRANYMKYNMDEEKLPEITDEDLVHDIGHQQFVNADECDMNDSSKDEPTSLRPEPLVLASVSCILDLVEPMCIVCTKCSKICTLKEDRVGTALILTWSCAKNHRMKTWSSQKKLGKRGVHSGDFMLATSILLSGNNFAKIALLMKFVGLKPMPSSFFYRIQAHYAAPMIKEYWTEILDETRSKYKGKDLVLAGDGRSDSPGHCSQYCTYTLMEENTQDIVDMVTVDKRQVGLKSPNMEAFALRKSLGRLEDAGLTVKELVTDAHSQIPPILREKNIAHSWDVWHGSKNLGKKLHQLASTKGCEELKPWVPDITNHFWKAAETAKGDPQLFKETMMGTLHHLVDEHEWLLGACTHGPLTDDDRKGKQWLGRNSKAMEGLRKIIGQPSWLRQASEHYVNFRHTGELEVLHHHMLMYASKRQSFSPPIMDARMMLSGIDYQKHKDRDYRRDEEGNLMFDKIYNKRSCFWYPTPLKVPKPYDYIADIQERIAKSYKANPGKMLTKVVMDEADPRRIQKNLAPKESPPTSQLVISHQTRMKGKLKWQNEKEKD